MACAAEAARLSLSSPHMPFEQADYAGLLARIAERISVPEAERARAVGHTLTLAQGLAAARVLLQGTGAG